MIDPLVAGLLVALSRIGALAVVLVIATNVPHNPWALRREPSGGACLDGIASFPPVVSQIDFPLFVVATTRIARCGLSARPDSARPAEPHIN